LSHQVEDREKAVLLIVETRAGAELDSGENVPSEANAEELRMLADSAGVELVDEMRAQRRSPDPRYHVGRGSADELAVRVDDSGADVVIVGRDLTPSQQRNLEDVCGTRVVDRSQLILDIFARRARTSEGKIQVELAQLQYLLPRLTGRGIEMSRIGGGKSGVATRGPGETKLETDRRRVRSRISVLKKELEEVVKHRTVQKRLRERLNLPRAALVGYTSAGKSTLMNLLSGSELETDARLFATLDPTTRKVDMPDCGSMMLSDTVGFLHSLPHHLIAAFRATLEEVTDADLLIHVVDASHPYMRRQMEAVPEVLSGLGITDTPTITVFNKIDLVKDQYEVRRTVAETQDSCYISALTGDGLKQLIDVICRVLRRTLSRIEVVIPYSRQDLLALCHEKGRVLNTEFRPEGTHATVEAPPDVISRLREFESGGLD